MSRSLLRYFVLSLFFLINSVSSQPVISSRILGLEDFISRLGDTSWLANFRDYQTLQFSSYDRTGGNDDYQNFLSNPSTRGSEKVMAEMDGPGAIVRIWSANAVDSGKIRIYLDGQKSPVISTAFKYLFNQSSSPFSKPVSRLSTGGYISYFPIPFAKHCKITIENPKNLYYQINGIRFDAGTEVTSLTLPLSASQEAALARVSKIWQTPGLETSHFSFAEPTSIAPHEEIELAASAGSGRILSLSLKIESSQGREISPELRRVILRGYFDGHTHADIEAPVLDLFSNSFGGQSFKSLLSGQGRDGFYLNLPMPFGRSYRFTLENETDHEVSASLSIKRDSTPFDPSREGYFHAKYMEENTRFGMPHIWLKSVGHRGHILGVAQTLIGNSIRILEGDEQIRIDSQSWIPSKVASTIIAPWNGTGTEDYFNSGWYFNQGPLVLATHGAVVTEKSGKISAFRWHLWDAPTFKSSIDAQIEHGDVNDQTGAYYASVVYWYSDGEAEDRSVMPKGSLIPILSH